MKSWNYLHSYGRDGAKKVYVEIYEQPAWREIVKPLVIWFYLHTPKWMEPGGKHPSVRYNDDDTCTFLWRVNLECWLGHDFHHRKRKTLHTLLVNEDA